MKEFNERKFCKDLIDLRGKETQEKFAQKLNINRSTLSLLETGKQLPRLDVFSRFCSLAKKNTDEYFGESTTDSLIYLKGCLEESDKKKIKEMAERIRLKEKYELLARRDSYGIN